MMENQQKTLGFNWIELWFFSSDDSGFIDTVDDASKYVW